MIFIPATTSSAAPGEPRALPIPALLLWGAGLFLAALLLFTRANDFPFWYHPDEGGKIRQIISGDWNFHHPMLLLVTARIAADLGHAGEREQSVVELGRWVTAAFAALAVATLSLLAWRYRGFAGAVAVGLLLLLHHQLFELSHYLKEDTALLAGVALVFLAITLFWDRPSAVRSALIGVACALALSGKYIGAIMIGFALPPILAAKGSSARFFAAFLAGLLLMVALVNYPVWRNLEAFRGSFDRELSLVVKGQRGFTRSVPHSQYWNVFRDNVSPALWPFLIWSLAGFWRTRRRRALPEWLITLFPISLAILLSFSPKSNDRYFLPATGMFIYLVGLGVVDSARWISSRYPCPFRWTVAAVLTLAAAIQFAGLARYYIAFSHDDRREMVAWIRTNLPADAVLAQDRRVSLPMTEDDPRSATLGSFPQKVAGTQLASDRETLDDMIRSGVTHVVVSESDYGRFFLKSLRPRTGYRSEFETRKRFYEELFARGERLWGRDRGTVIYLHPGLEIFRLPQK